MQKIGRRFTALTKNRRKIEENKDTGRIFPYRIRQRILPRACGVALRKSSGWNRWREREKGNEPCPPDLWIFWDFFEKREGFQILLSGGFC